MGLASPHRVERKRIVEDEEASSQEVGRFAENQNIDKA